MAEYWPQLQSVHLLGCLMLIFTTLVAAVLATFLKETLLPRHRSYPEQYPLQRTIRLMRNMHRMLDYIWEIFDEVGRKTGDKTIVYKPFGMPPFVFTNDVDNVTYILKTNFENFGKEGPQFKSKLQPLLGDGIFNSDGQQWFAHRKTSANLFKVIFLLIYRVDRLMFRRSDPIFHANHSLENFAHL